MSIYLTALPGRFTGPPYPSDVTSDAAVPLPRTKPTGHISSMLPTVFFHEYESRHVESRSTSP